jgi:tetratricopeptide (TPR) repeat protein
MSDISKINEEIKKIKILEQQLILLQKNYKNNKKVWQYIYLFYLKLDKKQEALDALNKYLELFPNSAIDLMNKGNLLHELKRDREALECYKNSIKNDKLNSLAFSNQANSFLALDMYKEALKSCDTAIKLNNMNRDGWMNKANVLFKMKNFEYAEFNARIAVDICPEAAATWVTLGRILNALNRDHEAVKCYEKALSNDPDFSQALINLGFTYARIGNTDLAVKFYEQAAECNPDLKAEVLWNIALIYLSLGRFKEGWKLYESRWEMKEFELQKINSIMPRWVGTQKLEGKKILVHAEQGLGDSIQFCRYLEKVEALGAEVTFKVQKPLIPIFKNLRGVKHLMALGDSNPPHDLHVPLLSLPGIFNTELFSIDRSDQYLKAEPQRITRWKEALQGDCYKIGINWQGSHGTQIDIGRSFNVRLFENISRLPNVQLISLQKGYGSEQLQNLPSGMKVLELGDEVDADGAFLDTAAVMKNLDLVISSDTAVVHLAGALGVKTWVALKLAPDWRFLKDRADSPWYSTLTLYRQEVAGEWELVFERMLRDLEANFNY